MAISDWIEGALALLGQVKDWFVDLFRGAFAFFRPSESSESSESEEARPEERSSTEEDVEAGARMLASENPRGSRELHIEQLHTQLRAVKPGQSLYARITGGAGWGPQGGRRPVSTEQPATEAGRELARQVLQGTAQSTLPGARKFFEPGQQDKAFAIAERGREKQKVGQPLTAQEQRLLGYRRDANAIRAKWLGEGAALVGAVDGVEFFT